MKCSRVLCTYPQGIQSFHNSALTAAVHCSIATTQPIHILHTICEQKLEYLRLARNKRSVLNRVPMRPRNQRIRGQIPIKNHHRQPLPVTIKASSKPLISTPKTTKRSRFENVKIRMQTHVSKNGNTSADPGLFLQSRIKSIAIANKPLKCTPASSIRRFASAASLASKVPDASVLAQTE